MAQDLSDELERNIPLSEMIQILRRELQVSMAQPAKEDLRFEVPEVELELKITVGRSATKGGRIQFWVVGAGGDVASGNQTVHTFRLTLKPIGPDGRTTEVADMVPERPE